MSILDAILEAQERTVRLSVGPHKYGSTQFNLPKAIADKIKQFASRISPKDLASDGVETEPHVTVKYGLHTDNPIDVESVVLDFGPVFAKLGKVSIFPASEATAQRGGEQYDVLKIDVDSEDLHSLNKVISDKLEHTDTHPDYKPHVTIAYLKPGRAKKYMGKSFENLPRMKLSNLIFSAANGKRKTTRLALITEEEVRNARLDPIRDLAQYYADLLNTFLHGMVKEPSDLLDLAEQDLEGTPYKLKRDQNGFWQVVRATMMFSVMRRIIWLGAQRSPKGGITIQGKFYRGGQFIPGKVIAKASPEEKAKLEARKQQDDINAAERKQERLKRGVDVAKLKATLEQHKGELSARQLGNAKRAFHALRRHHGDAVFHRIEEIANILTEQLAANEGRDWLTNQLRSKLAGLSEMVEMAEAAGIVVPEIEKPKKTAKPKKEPVAKARTLFSIVKQKGGLGPEQLKRNYGSESIKQEGLLGVTLKGGIGIDDMAATLVAEGHIVPPEGVNETDYLWEQLKARAITLHDAGDYYEQQFEREYAEYVRQAQEAQISESDIAEAIRSGQEEGEIEGSQSEWFETVGELAEESGDASFDFGANVEEESEENDYSNMSPEEYQKTLSQKFVDLVESGESAFKPGSIKIGSDGILRAYYGKKQGWTKPALFEPVWMQASHELGMPNPFDQKLDYGIGKQTFLDDKTYDQFVQDHYDGEHWRVVDEAESAGLSVQDYVKSKLDQLPGGKADNIPDAAFPQDKLAQGTEHELEHTNDAGTAKEIAKDHLAENGPEYYDDLEKVEGKKPSNIKYVRAKQGGEVSPVNGEFYRGGQLMPIHGLSPKTERSNTKGKGINTSPQKISESGKQKFRSSPMSPEQVDQEKERREEQNKWDQMNNGPLGKIQWLGDKPNRKAREITPDFKRWTSYIEEIGPNKLKKLISVLEPMVHKRIDSFTSEARQKPQSEWNKIPDDSEDWQKNQIREIAESDANMTRNNSRHEKKNPGSFYARQLISEFLTGQDVNNSVENMYELNRILADIESGKPEKFTPAIDSPKSGVTIDTGNTKQDSKRVEKMDMPNLKGSPKQVEWANKIRQQLINDVPEEYREQVAKNDDASFWINNRSDISYLVGGSFPPDWVKVSNRAEYKEAIQREKEKAEKLGQELADKYGFEERHWHPAKKWLEAPVVNTDSDDWGEPAANQRSKEGRIMHFLKRVRNAANAY